MTAQVKRRLDMVVRLRGFCAEHPELFENVKAFEKTLADLDAAIAELRAHLQAQDSGLASFHEYARMRGDARAALRRTLESIRTFAVTLGIVGLDEKFRLRAMISDTALLVRALVRHRRRADRQCARRARSAGNGVVRVAESDRRARAGDRVERRAAADPRQRTRRPSGRVGSHDEDREAVRRDGDA